MSHLCDRPLDTKLKTVMLRIYNRKLAERQRRKDFCVKYGTLDRGWDADFRQSKEFRPL